VILHDDDDGDDDDALVEAEAGSGLVARMLDDDDATVRRRVARSQRIDGSCPEREVRGVTGRRRRRGKAPRAMSAIVGIIACALALADGARAATATRAYVVDGSSCERVETMQDEASMVDGRATRWIRRARTRWEGLCDEGAAALTIEAGEVGLEEVSVEDARALGRTLGGASTIEVWFAYRGTERRGEMMPLFTIEDISRKTIKGMVSMDGSGLAMLAAESREAFSLGKQNDNTTCVHVVSDKEVAKVYVNARLALESTRGSPWRTLNEDDGAMVRLGGSVSSAGLSDAWWSGNFYRFAVYPFAMDADGVNKNYANHSVSDPVEHNVEVDDIDVTGASVAVFGVSTKMQFDVDNLDKMCDDDEQACDLTVESELIVRKLPLYGDLHASETLRAIQVNERIGASKMRYTAKSAPTSIDGYSDVFSDSIQFQISDDDVAQRFRFAVEVHKGVLACDIELVTVEDSVVTVTLQVIDTERVSADFGFEIMAVHERIALFFENGTTIPVGERMKGYPCGAQPSCRRFTLDEHTQRACLKVVLIPHRDYFNTDSAFDGPQHPPWPMGKAVVTYIGTSGEQPSKQARINVTVTGEYDDVQLSVNQTLFNAHYLRWVGMGRFRLRSRDYDARKLRVSIHSARANLFAITNVTALELCDNPFITGDGTGNEMIVFDASPSVISSALDSVVYINLKRGLTQDEINVRVGESSVTLVALLMAS
jgi:hypothetical protein